MQLWRQIVEIERIWMGILETVLQTASQPRRYGTLMGFGLIRLIIGVALAVVLIWLLVKVIKLVEAYTKKLKK
jgi:hypothetical protein